MLAKILGGWEPAACHLHLSPKRSCHSCSLGPRTALAAAGCCHSPHSRGLRRVRSPASCESGVLCHIALPAVPGYTWLGSPGGGSSRGIAGLLGGVPAPPAAQRLCLPAPILGSWVFCAAQPDSELGAGPEASCNQAKAAAEVPLSLWPRACTPFPLLPSFKLCWSG